MTVAMRAREAADNIPRTAPGLKLWLDARRPGATLADGAAVAAWNDLSGLSNNVVQATAAKKPVYRTATTTGYLTLPGVAGNYASAPDSAALSITGDIDIRVKCALTDWTPATAQTLLAKIGGSGHYSYQLYIEATTGKPRLHVSLNGTAFTNTACNVGTGVTDGAVKWVRVTRVAATGVAQYFLSDDGTSWTQLGVDQSAALGDIFDSDQMVEVGTSGAGVANPSTGKFYRAQVLNGINGTVAFDADFTTTGRSFLESSSNHAVVTINGDQARESVSTIPSILFDGVDDVLSAAFTQAQPLTVYIAHMPGSTGTARTWVGGATYWTGVSTTAYEAYGGTALTTGTPTTAPHVVSVVYNDASSTLSVDGTAVTGDTGTNGLTALNIGALNAASQFAQGAFQAVLIFSGAHSANTRKKIERWLGRQYVVTVAQ